MVRLPILRRTTILLVNSIIVSGCAHRSQPVPPDYFCCFTPIPFQDRAPYIGPPIPPENGSQVPIHSDPLESSAVAIPLAVPPLP